MRRMSRLLTRRDGVLRAAVAPAVESLESRTLLSISLDSGVLTVMGTAGRDKITFSLKPGDSSTLVATCNSQRAQYPVSSITQIQAYGARGGDSISASTLSIPVAFHGGAGADTLAGGSANDSLWGGGGNDVLMGGAGNNALYGEAGDDRILGGSGTDTIVGGGGHDIINSGGGSNESISSTNPADVNAGAGAVFEPLYRPAATGAAPLTTFQFGAVGLVPSQIRTAYDLRYKALGTKGEGQTIYIVDAFTGANVLGDLNVFSAQFGLPLMNSSNFQIVNANDGGFSPAVDSGWAGEIALDVQWAHAIAPKAKIVLVQADTALPPDMLRAVQLAAQMSENSGGGVVSMSFGGPEVVTSPLDPKIAITDPFIPNFEAVFKSSPKTTFVAAAGDTPGVSYPATSPNVLGVGGTLLNVDSDGNRIPENDPSLQETAWFTDVLDGTGGGESTVFPHPDYQSPLEAAGTKFGRLSPDVGYNADPDSGVAVYNSTAVGQFAGWVPQGVGGTSAGSPQWAALIALTNGLRAQAGRSAIGSRANVGIYDVAQGDYAATFHDITVGGFPGDPLAKPPLPDQLAGVGFDLSTGWGTPRATALVSELAGSNAPFLAAGIGWSATVDNPALAGFTNLTVPAGGTGFATGSSRISTQFNFVPNIWDTTGLVVSLSSSDLYSAVPNPAVPGTYRVYGNGTVIFGAPVPPTTGTGTVTGTSMTPKTIVVTLPDGTQAVAQGNLLKFNGWITVDAQGNESIDCDFWSVDALGNKLPTSPFALAQLSVKTGEVTFGFSGNFQG